MTDSSLILPPTECTVNLTVIFVFQCKRYEGYQKKVVSLWQKNIPLCVEVLLVAACVCEDSGDGDSAATDETSSKSLLLEQWYFNISYCR